MTDFDLDDIETETDPDDANYVRLKKEDVRKLRGAARRAGAAERELRDIRRVEKVRQAGLEGLNERQLNALAREAGDDDSPETLRQIAVDFGWATPPEQTSEQQQVEAEVAATEQAVAAGSGADPAGHRTTLTPEDVNGWAVDKQMRFLNAHPDDYERLLRGEPVSLPGGFD